MLHIFQRDRTLLGFLPEQPRQRATRPHACCQINPPEPKHAQGYGHPSYLPLGNIQRARPESSASSKAAGLHPICEEKQSFAAGQGHPSRSRSCRRLQGCFPRTTRRNSATRSQLGRITRGKTSRHGPCPDNRLRQRRARLRVVHSSHAALKYELGKDTKRDGFGLKGTHLFLRSIYLFIN